MMGCDAPISPERVAAGQVHYIGGKKISRCPMALLADPWAQMVVEHYQWWKTGQLGLRCEKPSAKMSRAITLTDSYYNEQASIAMQRRRKK